MNEKLGSSEHISLEFGDASPIRDRWQEGLDGGFVVVPTVLLRHQAELGLDSEEVVILTNLLSHWWEDDRMPFPRSETLAQRMGVGRRTVQRRLQSLEEKKFLRREQRPREGDESGRDVTHYDLAATVEKLRPFGILARERKEARIRLQENRHGVTAKLDWTTLMN